MNNKEQLNNIRKLLELEKAQEARSLLSEVEVQETVEYYLIKGSVEQKFQNWGEAINAFNRVLELDAENIEATNNLHLIQNILNFWNPDMFNP